MSTTTKSAIQTANLYSLDRLRELGATNTTREAERAADAGAVAVDASSVTRSVAQFDQLARLAYSRAVPSSDARYVKFVEAVRALRVDLDFSSLSRAQIDRIIESAERHYLVNDGVPEPVEPPPIRPASDLPSFGDVPPDMASDDAAETAKRGPATVANDPPLVPPDPDRPTPIDDLSADDEPTHLPSGSGGAADEPPVVPPNADKPAPSAETVIPAPSSAVAADDLWDPGSADGKSDPDTKSI